MRERQSTVFHVDSVTGRNFNSGARRFAQCWKLGNGDEHMSVSAKTRASLEVPCNRVWRDTTAPRPRVERKSRAAGDRARDEQSRVPWLLDYLTDRVKEGRDARRFGSNREATAGDQPIPRAAGECAVSREGQPRAENCESSRRILVSSRFFCHSKRSVTHGTHDRALRVDDAHWNKHAREWNWKSSALFHSTEIRVLFDRPRAAQTA